MNVRLTTVLTVALSFFACGLAQASAERSPLAYYSTPVPSSTDPAMLRDLAVQREVRERFSRGIDALNRSDYTSAIAEFEAVLKHSLHEPQGSTAHYDLALALAGAGRLDRAAAECQTAIALDPGFLAAYANLITIDLRRGDDTGARKAADRFVALAPTSARALYARGLTALRNGDVATAQSDFNKLLQKNPAYAPVHYDLALVALHEGRFDVAEQELHTALASAPDYPRARFALGIVLLREGRKAEARVAFEQVVREASDPNLRNMAASMRDSLGTQ
ncbi:MAG: tetratricopeptide repeat protein [Polyangiaceae bacterium]